MGALFVVDGGVGAEDLGGDLFDLGNRRADLAGIGPALGGSLDQLVQPAAERQQQGGFVAQLLGQAGFEGFQQFGQGAKQR
ncbi:hypothetical protein D3C78_1030000 [compost metagenome]